MRGAIITRISLQPVDTKPPTLKSTKKYPLLDSSQPYTPKKDVIYIKIHTFYNDIREI